MQNVWLRPVKYCRVFTVYRSEGSHDSIRLPCCGAFVLVFSSKFSLKKKSGKRQQKLPLSHKYTAYFDSVGLELHFTGIEVCLRFLHQSQSELKQNQSNSGIEICSRITRKHLRKITKYHATLPSNMSLSFPLSHYHSRLFCSSRIHGVRASLSHNRTVPL